MRKCITTILVLICMLCLAGCESKESNVAGKVYTYEKEGFGGDFCIYINEDGTFTYYEGMLSSYFGIGTWDVKKSVLTLTDDDEMGFALVNHFRINGDKLIFIEEDSDNFLYVNVKDGESFIGEPFRTDEQQISSLLLEKQ